MQSMSSYESGRYHTTPHRSDLQTHGCIASRLHAPHRVPWGFADTAFFADNSLSKLPTALSCADRFSRCVATTLILIVDHKVASSRHPGSVQTFLHRAHIYTCIPLANSYLAALRPHLRLPASLLSRSRDCYWVHCATHRRGGRIVALRCDPTLNGSVKARNRAVYLCQ